MPKAPARASKMRMTTYRIGAMFLAIVGVSIWADDHEEREAGWSTIRFAAYDALPETDPETLARTYGGALEVPGVATLGARGRRALFDAATARHVDRLLDRGPDAAAGRRHAERLARSAAGRKRPDAVAAVCARHGLADSVCAAHRDYAQRAAVLEAMLAAGRLTATGLARQLMVLAPGTPMSGGAARTVDEDALPDRDGLPNGPPAEVAMLYHSSLAVPGVADRPLARRTALLDAATALHRQRILPGPAVSAVDRAAYAKRLADSRLGRSRPGVVRQACAQFGLASGVCSAHRGYVRRALVLAEMLALGQVTLAELETELEGAPRPGKRGYGRGISR